MSAGMVHRPMSSRRVQSPSGDGPVKLSRGFGISAASMREGGGAGTAREQQPQEQGPNPGGGGPSLKAESSSHGEEEAVLLGTRRGRARDLHSQMVLTRRIKACRSWRSLQELYGAEVQRYNCIHYSATIVALRR